MGGAGPARASSRGPRPGPLTVRVCAAADLPDRATVRVTVWDVTRADAVARPVATRSVHPHGGTVDGVELPAPPPVRGKRYQVSVHVDVDGSGEVVPGDWVSTAAHPVPSRGGDLLVPVSRV